MRQIVSPTMRMMWMMRSSSDCSRGTNCPTSLWSDERAESYRSIRHPSSTDANCSLLDLQMEDFLTYSQQILEQAHGLDSIGVREVQYTLRMSPGFEAEKKELERFLFQNVYRHPRLIDVRQRAATRLQQLFILLKAYPERLPERFQRLGAEWGTERAIGVYLAGMTDRFCDDQYVAMVEMGRSQAADWS
ncbi:MAG: hypothetical protein FJ308_15830 [Planctomycetes bacterium]|nr:hypothetical protein [Planctomycetota bacterium]